MKNKIIVVFSSHLGDEKNNEFINHIHDTIGVNHDVICYTNYNQFSLTEIYNKAINEYNNPDIIFVFCHPDIIFKTNKWGKILLTKFNTLKYSIIGVAGSKILSDNGIWWTDKSKMIGIVEHTNGLRTWVSEYSHENKGQVTPVVVIDGLFIAIDTTDMDNFFDEEFKGFHFYDISLCLPKYLDGFDIGVTTDIRITHKSVGMVNDQWEQNRVQFVEKYKRDLPLTLE